MTTYHSILVVASHEAQMSPAIERAATLARAAGATLHLFAAVYDPAIDLAEVRVGNKVAARARHDLVSEFHGRLKQLAASLAKDGFTVSSEARWSAQPHQAILEKILATGAQLLVKDARRESLLQRALHTPLDRKLMRMVPCELMLVDPHRDGTPKKLAVAIDLLAEGRGATAFNHHILSAAMRLAQYYGASLDVVSVFSCLPIYGASAASVALMMDQDQLRHQEAYKNFMHAENVPAERRHLLVGPASEAILKFAAEQDIDTLVCGSNHHAGWERMLLGSTAESLAVDTNTNLVLIKPKGFERVLAEHRG